MRSVWAAIAGSAVVLFAVGCGSEEGPTVFPVTGTVTYKGAPVEGATVTFVPDGQQESAVGRTDASGVYKLKSLGFDGAEPGQYKVKVVKYDGPTSSQELTPMDQANFGEEDPDALGYNPDAPAQDTRPKHLLPEKFSHDFNTPLSYTVSEGENVYDINLDAN